MYIIGLIIVFGAMALYATDQAAMYFLMNFTIVIPMVVCTRVILRAMKGPLMLDKVQEKIRNYFMG